VRVKRFLTGVVIGVLLSAGSGIVGPFEDWRRLTTRETIRKLFGCSRLLRKRAAMARSVSEGGSAAGRLSDRGIAFGLAALGSLLLAIAVWWLWWRLPQ
jgi:hypothetical protein